MATIQGIYVALFGRPADPLGLAYFNEATDNGANLTAIGDLAATAEYQDRFDGLNNAQIVNEIYQSLFGRAPDLAGLEFFVAALNNGTYNINNVAIAILDGAQGADADIVANKVAAADAFTAALDTGEEVIAYNGSAAADAGRAYLSGVTADEASIPDEAATDAAIAAIVSNAPQGPQGGEFALTPGNDYADTSGSIKNGGLMASDFAFTSRNDKVIANAATLAATDTLLDGSTTDRDVLEFTGAAITAIGNATSVQNIEVLDIRLANAAASAAALTNYTGVQTVQLSGTIAAASAITLTGFQASGVSQFDVTATGAAATSSVVINEALAHQAITVSAETAIVKTITLGNGNNSITTGAGNDSVTLGGGNNVVNTAAGNDTVTINGSGDNEVTAGAGNDTVTINGNGANTVDLGDGTNSYLGGGNGNNTVTGGAGVDTIVLGDGNNVITTGAGADVITVGTGANTITAGAGADTVTLGAGTAASTLVFAAGDSAAAAGGFDAITGFTVAAGLDKLDFEGGSAGTAANFVAVAGVGGDTFASALVAAQAAFDGDVTTEYYALSNTADTWVFADVDGDNVIDYAVQLTGLVDATTLTFASFV